MQTTLLGFAFAVILALLVALIGPFLVDWTQFRSVFEAEASRMVGLPVRVQGAIDARLLPSPSLTLHGLEIGGPNAAQTLQARRLNVEFALGSLVRGELRAIEAQLAGPEVTVAIDESGSVDLPKLSAGFVPDSLSIERLNIEDGRAHVVNAVTGSRTTLDNVWFNGDLRSLAGPFKGEGAFVTAGELYGYRIAAGRLGEDGRLRLRLSLDPSDRPLTAEAEGALVVGQGKPRFEGAIAVSRPAGLIRATGQSEVKPPWRLTSRVSLDAGGAKLERIEFLYGPEDGGVRLAGTADLRLGPAPRLKGVLSVRQLDLDRLIATPDKPIRLPAEALTTLLNKYGSALQPSIPTELSISADTITVGGASIQLFGADLRIGADAWMLDRVEFRAPGLAQINLSGKLVLTPSAGFSGPVTIETGEPGALAGWLAGRSDPATQIRPFKARGEVVLDHKHVAIERLQAEIDRKAVEGRIRYDLATSGQPSRLEAELKAPELDIDPLWAFAEVAFSGSAFRPPDEIALGLEADRARIAGVEAKTVRVRLKRDAKLLLVEHFTVASFGGASLAATGRVDTSGAAPRGSLALDIEAREMDGVIAVVEKFAPTAAAPLRLAAERVPEAKLRVTLALDGPARVVPGAKTSARFAVEGRLGGLRASLRGQAQQDSATAAAEGLTAIVGSDVRLEGQMDGDDGRALVALLRLDKAVAVGQGPGFVNVVMTGKIGEALGVDGRLVAGGLDVKTSGTMRIADDQPSADLQLDIVNADLGPLAGITGRVAALPLTLRSRVSLTDHSVTLADLNGTLAGTELRGTLNVGFGPRVTVAGEIEADTIDAAAVIAAAIGAPPTAKPGQGSPAGWSTEPYGAGQFADIDGRVDLKIMRATLTPSLPARQLRSALVFRGSEITLDDFDAHVAGGRLGGRLALRHGADGLTVRAKINLSKVDVAAVLPSEARPALGGRLSAKLDLDASGLSPKALIGSLAGSGTVRLEDSYLSGLNPKVFDTIIRASDQGLATGAAKIREIVSAGLDSGRLRIPLIETSLTINAGQVRLANTVAEAESAELAATGSFDLIQHQMDVRLTLSGQPRNDGSSGSPDIFIGLKGPVSAPNQVIDVSALAGWLTIRRIDRQAKKLEALEAAAREEQDRRTRARSPVPSVAAPAPKPAEPPAIAAPAAVPRTVPSENKPAAHAAQPKPVVTLPPVSAVPVPPAKPEPVTPSVDTPSVAAPPTVSATTQPDARVPQIVAPEPGSSAAIAAPPTTPARRSTPAAKPKLAPPLPAPLDILTIPRGPRLQGAAVEREPAERLPPPNSRPSVLDSLLGPRR